MTENVGSRHRKARGYHQRVITSGVPLELRLQRAETSRKQKERQATLDKLTAPAPSSIARATASTDRRHPTARELSPYEELVLSRGTRLPWDPEDGQHHLNNVTYNESALRENISRPLARETELDATEFNLSAATNLVRDSLLLQDPSLVYSDSPGRPGAHRDGYSDEKCRNVLIKHCSWIPRQFDYAEGMKRIFPVLREYLGDENLDLATGVLYEVIELPVMYGWEEGGYFQRWKSDHLKKDKNLENTHVPGLGNIIVGSVVLTERLFQHRQQKYASSAPMALLNSCDRSPAQLPLTNHHTGISTNIRSQKDWQIDYSCFISSPGQGTRVHKKPPSAADLHRMVWDGNFGTSGRMVEEREVATSGRVPQLVRGSRLFSQHLTPIFFNNKVSGSGSHDPNSIIPMTNLRNSELSKKLVNRTVNKHKNASKASYPRISCGCDTKAGHASFSVGVHKKSLAVMALPDPTSEEGHIYYSSIVNQSLPDGVIVPTEAFARKNELVPRGTLVAPASLVSHKILLAEELAIQTGIKASLTAATYNNPYDYKGPFTSDLMKDGSMDYQWDTVQQSTPTIFGIFPNGMPDDRPRTPMDFFRCADGHGNGASSSLSDPCATSNLGMLGDGSYSPSSDTYDRHHVEGKATPDNLQQKLEEASSRENDPFVIDKHNNVPKDVERQQNYLKDGTYLQPALYRRFALSPIIEDWKEPLYTASGGMKPDAKVLLRQLELRELDRKQAGTPTPVGRLAGKRLSVAPLVGNDDDDLVSKYLIAPEEYPQAANMLAPPTSRCRIRSVLDWDDETISNSFVNNKVASSIQSLKRCQIAEIVERPQQEAFVDNHESGYDDNEVGKFDNEKVEKCKEEEEAMSEVPRVVVCSQEATGDTGREVLSSPASKAHDFPRRVPARHVPSLRRTSSFTWLPSPIVSSHTHKLPQSSSKFPPLSTIKTDSFLDSLSLHTASLASIGDTTVRFKFCDIEEASETMDLNRELPPLPGGDGINEDLENDDKQLYDSTNGCTLYSADRNQAAEIHAFDSEEFGLTEGKTKYHQQLQKNDNAAHLESMRPEINHQKHYQGGMTSYHQEAQPLITNLSSPAQQPQMSHEINPLMGNFQAVSLQSHEQVTRPSNHGLSKPLEDSRYFEKHVVNTEAGKAVNDSYGNNGHTSMTQDMFMRPRPHPDIPTGSKQTRSENQTLDRSQAQPRYPAEIGHTDDEEQAINGNVSMNRKQVFNDSHPRSVKDPASPPRILRSNRGHSCTIAALSRNDVQDYCIATDYSSSGNDSTSSTVDDYNENARSCSGSTLPGIYRKLSTHILSGTTTDAGVPSAISQPLNKRSILSSGDGTFAQDNSQVSSSVPGTLSASFSAFFEDFNDEEPRPTPYVHTDKDQRSTSDNKNQITKESLWKSGSRVALNRDPTAVEIKGAAALSEDLVAYGSRSVMPRSNTLPSILDKYSRPDDKVSWSASTRLGRGLAGRPYLYEPISRNVVTAPSVAHHHSSARRSANTAHGHPAAAIPVVKKSVSSRVSVPSPARCASTTATAIAKNIRSGSAEEVAPSDQIQLPFAVGKQNGFFQKVKHFFRAEVNVRSVQSRESDQLSLTMYEIEQFYMDINSQITRVANKFLDQECLAGRVNLDDVLALRHEWAVRGFKKVREFNYDQFTQWRFLTIIEEPLRFYGGLSSLQRRMVLDEWKPVAIMCNNQQARTTIVHDSTMKQHLQSSVKILELLGAKDELLEELIATERWFLKAIAAADVRLGRYVPIAPRPVVAETIQAHRNARILYTTSMDAPRAGPARVSINPSHCIGFTKDDEIHHLTVAHSNHSDAPKPRGRLPRSPGTNDLKALTSLKPAGLTRSNTISSIKSTAKSTFNLITRAGSRSSRNAE